MLGSVGLFVLRNQQLKNEVTILARVIDLNHGEKGVLLFYKGNREGCVWLPGDPVRKYLSSPISNSDGKWKNPGAIA